MERRLVPLLATAGVSAGATYLWCRPPAAWGGFRTWLRRAATGRQHVNTLTLDLDAAAADVDHTAPTSPTTPPPVGFLGGIEMGGTTCVAAVSSTDDPCTLIARVEVPTVSPDETFPAIVDFLKKYELAAVGVASFGPLDLTKDSPSYGFITTTPKAAFRNADVVGYFRNALAPDLPIGFDTDVNAPAIAELEYGNHGRDVQSCAYITVGTGVGVGAVINGAPVHGLVHMEGGHIIPPKRHDDAFPGVCALHRDCVEGLVASAALRARTERDDLVELDDEDPVWDTVAFYLAHLCASIVYLLSPHVVVLSGGIMQRKVLFQKIRVTMVKLLNGYVTADRLTSKPELFVRESRFGNQAGIIGALEIARRVLYRIDA